MDDDLSSKESVGAAFIRAMLLRLRSLRLPRQLPVRVVAKATDRLSTIIDVSEAVLAKGGLRAVLGGGAKAFATASGSLVASLGKATIAGAILFSVFESAMSIGGSTLVDLTPRPRAVVNQSDRFGLGYRLFQAQAVALPFISGALAGAVNGGCVVILDCFIGSSGRLTWLADECRLQAPRVAAMSAMEWGAAFGVYFLIRRAMNATGGADDTFSKVGDSSARLEDATAEKLNQIQGDEALLPTQVAAVFAAAIGGGIAQASAAGLAANGWSLRNLKGALSPRSIGTASLGLVAYELARYLE